jgi:hypothetical protein
MSGFPPGCTQADVDRELEDERGLCARCDLSFGSCTCVEEPDEEPDADIYLPGGAQGARQ